MVNSHFKQCTNCGSNNLKFIQKNWVISTKFGRYLRLLYECRNCKKLIILESGKLERTSEYVENLASERPKPDLLSS